MSSSFEHKLIDAARRQAGGALRCELYEASAAGGAFSPGAAPMHWDQYELLGEVRRGGQGVVYRALQRSTQRTVAIKVLRERPLSISADRARFEREIQILAAVSHPNVVTIHESGTRDGWSYYVMDFIDGEPLDRFVAKQPWKNARDRIDGILALLAKVCDAVHAAHLHGVFHRDLKPGNILVDRSGEPRVVDFGLARSVHPEDEGPEREPMTQTGQFLGTLPWASPEQAAGRTTELDLRTDVYSLGVVLFQLLTGCFPYQVNGAVRDVLNEIVQTPPQRPRSALPELDDDAETIVLKCLEKSPERRYQSAGELARDLRRRLAGEPIDAKRDSMLYVLRKSVQRHRAAFAVGLLLLAMLSASTLGFRTLYRQQAEAHRLADEAAADARQRFREAREVAEFLMDDVAARLGTLLGASELRKALLLDAYNRFSALARDSDDYEVQLDLARLRGKLARLARALSRSDEACEHCEAGLAGVDRLLIERPDDRALVALRADLLRLRGDLALWRGDTDAAEQAFEVGFRTFERLLEHEPDDVTLLQGLSLACERRALLASTRGDPDASLAWAARMLDLKQQIVAKTPHEPDARYELSVAHERMGRAAPDPQAAQSHIEAALQIRESLVQQSPQDGQFLRALSISYEQLAMLAAKRSDSTADLAWTDRMVALKRRLIAIEPQNFLYQNDYAISLDRMAGQIRESEPARALALNQEALEIYRRQVEGDPGSVRFKSDLLASLHDVARSARAAGNLEQARERWNELRERLESQCAERPSDGKLRLRLARVLCDLAELERDAGQLDSMRSWRAAARAECETLQADESTRENAAQLAEKLVALPE